MTQTGPIDDLYKKMSENQLIKKEDYSVDEFKSWLHSDPTNVNTLYSKLQKNDLIKKDNYTPAEFSSWLGVSAGEDFSDAPKLDPPADIMAPSLNPVDVATSMDQSLVQNTEPRSQWLNQHGKKSGSLLEKIATPDQEEIDNINKDPIQKVKFERQATLAKNEAIANQLNWKTKAIDKIGGEGTVDFLYDFENEYNDVHEEAQKLLEKDDKIGAEARIKKWEEENKDKIAKYNKLLEDPTIKVGMDQMGMLAKSYRENRDHFKDVAESSPEYQEMSEKKRKRQKFVDAIDDEYYYNPQLLHTKPETNYWNRMSRNKVLEVGRYVTRALANITDLDMQGDVDVFDRLDQSLAKKQDELDVEAPLKTELQRGMFQRYADFKGKRVFVDGDKNVVLVTDQDGNMADENYSEEFINEFNKANPEVETDFSATAAGGMAAEAVVDFVALLSMGGPMAAGFRSLGTGLMASKRLGTLSAVTTQLSPRFYDKAKEMGASDDFASYYSAIASGAIGAVNMFDPIEAGGGINFMRYLTPKVVNKRAINEIAEKGMTAGIRQKIKRRTLSGLVAFGGHGGVEFLEEAVLEKMAENTVDAAVDNAVAGKMYHKFDPLQQLNEGMLGMFIGGGYGTITNGHMPNSEYYKQALYTAAENIDSYENMKLELKTQDPDKFTDEYFEDIDQQVYGAKEAFEAIPDKESIPQNDRVDLYNLLNQSKILEKNISNVPQILKGPLEERKAKIDDQIVKLLPGEAQADVSRGTQEGETQPEQEPEQEQETITQPEEDAEATESKETESIPEPTEQQTETPTLEQQELESQLESAISERETAKQEFEKKRKAYDESVKKDQEDLFGDRESQQEDLLIDTRAELDPEKRQEALAPARARLEKAESEVSRIQEKLEQQGTETIQRDIFDESSTEAIEKSLPENEVERRQEIHKRVREKIFGPTEEKSQAQIKRDKKAAAKNFTPRTPRDAAVFALANGYKFNPRAMAEELGWVKKGKDPNLDFRDRVMADDAKVKALQFGEKEGKTIEQVAEDLSADLSSESGIQFDEQDIRNELITALNEFKSAKDAREFIYNKQQEQKQAESGLEMEYDENAIRRYAELAQKEWDGPTAEVFDALMEDYTDESGNIDYFQLAEDIINGEVEIPPELTETIFLEVLEGTETQAVNEPVAGDQESEGQAEARGRVAENIEQIPDGTNPQPFYNQHKDLIESDPELKQQFDKKKAAYRKVRDQELEERRESITEKSWNDANRRKVSFQHADGQLNGVATGKVDGKFVIIGDNGVVYHKDPKDVAFDEPMAQDGLDPSERASKRYLSWVAKKLKRSFPQIDIKYDAKTFEKAFSNVSNTDIENAPIAFIDGDVIYINPKKARIDTPLHEIAHPFIEIVKANFPALYEQGMEMANPMVKEALENPDTYERGLDITTDNPYYEWAKKTYKQRSGESDVEFEIRLAKESWAQSLAESGAEVMAERFKDRKNPLKRLQRFVNRFWNKVKDFFGQKKVVDFEHLTLAGLNNMIVQESWTIDDIRKDNNEKLAWLNDNLDGFHFKETAWDQWLRIIQDKYRGIRTTQKAIEARGGKITEDTDLEMWNEVATGKMKHKIDAVEQKIMKSLAHSSDASMVERFDKEVDKEAVANFSESIMDQLGFDLSARKNSELMEALSIYMYAKHAPEANKELQTRLQAQRENRIAELDEKIKKAIEEKNKSAANSYANERKRIKENDHPRYPEPGEAPSGMSTQEAEVVNNLVEEHGLTEVFEKYNKEFKEEVIDKIPDMLLDYGLIDRDLHAKLKGTYENYVPLMVSEKIQDGRGAGAGSWSIGKTVHARKGASRFTPDKRENVLTAALHKYEETIIKGERNLVNEALLQLAEENPNERHWEVIRPRSIPEYNRFGDVVGFKPIEEYDKETDVKMFKDGKPVLIRIHNEFLRDGLKKKGVVGAVPVLRHINNVLRHVYTIYNPEFILTNFERDVMTAFTNISKEDGEKIKRTFVSGIKPAFGAVYQHTLGKGSGKWNDIVEDYRAHGGDISWVNSESLNDFAKKAAKKVNKINNPSTFDKAGDAIWYMYSYIDAGTRAAELASRVSAYNAMIKGGMSKNKAAQKAKNLTINFEKKGTVGLAMDSFFLFANAGWQAAKIMTTNLATSPMVRKVASAQIGFGFLVAMLNNLIDEDEYWVLDQTYKDSYLVFMLPESVQKKMGGVSHFKIAKPYGYGFFITLGEQIHEVSTGRASQSDILVNSALSFINNLSPFKSADFVDLMVPTAAKGAASVIRNKAWHGGPVYPEQPQWSAKKPDHELHFKNVNPWSKAFTEWMNNNTGGNEEESGMVDISPESLDYMINSYGGGATKFWKDLISTPISAMSENELPDIKNVPMLRKLFGKTGKFNYVSPIYDMVNEAERTQFSGDQRKVFYRHIGMALERGFLTQKQAKELKTKFEKGQMKLDFAEAESNE